MLHKSSGTMRGLLGQSFSVLLQCLLFTKQASALSKKATPATICARIRSTYLLSLLDDATFNAFARAHWSRQIYMRLLRFAYDPAELNKLRLRGICEKVYLYGVAEQFCDLTVSQSMVKDWEAAVTRVAQWPAKHVTGTAQVCLEWLRHRLTPGRLFGALPDVLRIVPYESYTEHGEAACELHDLISLASCEELVASAAPDLSKLWYFKVVNAYPSRRTLKHPHHLGRRPNVVAIIRYTMECVENSQIRLKPAFMTEYLDLSFMISTKFCEFLESFWSFHGIEYGSRLDILPRTMSILNESPIPLPPPWSDSKDALAMVPTELSHLPTDAHRVISQLARSGNFADADRLRDVTTLEAYTSDIGEVLKASGIIEAQRSETGQITRIGVEFNAVRYIPLVRMSQPSLEFNLAEKASCAAKHSKLDLVRILMRQGFQASWSGDLKYWDAEAAAEFRAQALVSGSKLYFVALVLRDEILLRNGIILHNGSAKYYRLLLLLKDLSVLSGLRDDPGSLTQHEMQDLASDETLHEPLQNNLAADEGLHDMIVDGGAVSDDESRSESWEAMPVELSKFAADSAQLRSWTFGNAVIHFDNCSHSSGKLRAYTKCKVHAGCTQHCQVETAGGRHQAISRLMAWLHWAEITDMPRSAHSGQHPPDHLVTDFADRITTH